MQYDKIFLPSKLFSNKSKSTYDQECIGHIA
jgi:hypothetical protein